MKIIGFVKFYNEEELLDGCLSHLKSFCDDIVCCDDSSTDRSFEIAQKYTDKIITLPNEFVAELEHKQKLLDFLLKKIPDVDWIVHLDPDEKFDKPEKIRPLLESLDKSYDAVCINLKNLWLSEEKYRVDDNFNFWWKSPMWRNTGELKFDTSKGLHKMQNPYNLRKYYFSDICILHYGFAKREYIMRKYDTYKVHGQSGHMLERIHPDAKAKVMPIVYTPENPKVTVGIPIFADTQFQLQYLKEAINSVHQQTYGGEIEILVVDDGSPSEYAEQIHNICSVLNATYFRCDKNSGIGHARNIIIDNAKGDFIYFLSSDDFLMDMAVEVMMKNYKEPAIYWSQYVTYPENRLYAIPPFKSYEDFVLSCISHARNNSMFVCYNLFGPKEIWKKVMYWNEKAYGEDLAHLLESLLVKKIKFVYVPEPLFWYRIHEMMKTQKIGKNIPANNRDTFNKINKMIGKEVM